MHKAKLIAELVALVKGNSLFREESIEGTIAHYTHAYERSQMLYYVIEDDRVIGFIDGFKLPREPHSYEEAIAMFKEHPENTGKVAVLVNMVITGGTHTALKLMQMIKNDHNNSDWDVILWYNVKTGKFRRFTNARREPCRETAE